MSQHCRANPCCGDVPCRGVPVPQHASGYPSFNPPASTDLREENERLEAERAEQWRLRREMGASHDMERALAATLSAENAALTERLERVEGIGAAYRKYLAASDLYNERLAILKTKEPGTMRVDEGRRAIDEARREFDRLCVDLARAALAREGK